MHDAGQEAGASRVLVVDDDASIRLLCRVNLELAGYAVCEAASLEEARTRLAAEPVDVVLLDLHLGCERSGELVSECRARRPPAPVVLVTGESELTADEIAAADAVLPKPFRPEQLLATVRDCCGAPAPR